MSDNGLSAVELRLLLRLLKERLENKRVQRKGLRDRHPSDEQIGAEPAEVVAARDYGYRLGLVEGGEMCLIGVISLIEQSA